MPGFKNITVSELEALLQQGGITALVQAGLPVSA